MTADALIEAMNRAGRDGFVARLGALYEHSPWVAAAAWALRPFADRPGLHAAMQRAVETAPPDRQLALILAHPDLAGRLARAGAVGAHSTGEQRGLGLDRLSDDEYDRFDRLNAAYRDRFGFPFVVAAGDHTRASVLDAFERRLRHDKDEERRAALAEIGRIAWFRLHDLA